MVRRLAGDRAQVVFAYQGADAAAQALVGEMNAQGKRGAVVRVLADVTARMVDPDCGTILQPGVEGILELQGSQLGTGFLVGGTAWLRPTGRAVIDAGRFLYMRRGFKIHPGDVLAALRQHPAVREAAVVGVPDEPLGAVPAAALNLREGHAAPETDTPKAWLRARPLPD